MKALTFLLSLFILTSTLLTAQSTERFIRIIGNSKKEFNATGIIATVNIAEQQPNEYKQLGYLPFEAVYTNYLEELFTIGITENQLVRSQKNPGKIGSSTAREYAVSVPLVMLDKLTAIRAPGVNITDMKYTFTSEDISAETILAKSAIDDARRKAQALCVELKMKLGRILNIEDTSSGCCTHLEDSSFSHVEKDYKVTVTFELID